MSTSTYTAYTATLFSKLFNYLFDTTVVPKTAPTRILATGKWRQYELRTLFMKSVLGHPVTILSQSDEGEYQAKCAHAMMNRQGYISHIDNKLYLYVGAGRGSIQFTVLDSDGNFMQSFNSQHGYPKEGEANIEKFNSVAGEVYRIYPEIELIVGYDSIYHHLKDKCPVIPDKGELPLTITTTCEDFAALGYLTEYKKTKMIVVRNFKIGDEMCKITFVTGDDLVIDLGTGKASLVDPDTGIQLENRELPNDWMTDDGALVEVSNIVRSLLDCV